MTKKEKIGLQSNLLNKESLALNVVNFTTKSKRDRRIVNTSSLADRKIAICQLKEAFKTNKINSFNNTKLNDSQIEQLIGGIIIPGAVDYFSAKTLYSKMKYALEQKNKKGE